MRHVTHRRPKRATVTPIRPYQPPRLRIRREEGAFGVHVEIDPSFIRYFSGHPTSFDMVGTNEKDPER